MKDIAILGAGGFGRETALMIKQINQINPTWNLLGFYDDAYQPQQQVFDLPVLGTMAQVKSLPEPLSIVIAVSDPSTRKNIYEQIQNPLVHFPTLVHPHSQIGDARNTLGKGCIVTTGCILTTHITLGDFVIINLASTIGHDCFIGNYTSIMPNCSISGGVTLRDECFVGSGARILQNLTIGENSTIGAGAVVTKSFPAKSKLVGVPAKNVNQHVERI